MNSLRKHYYLMGKLTGPVMVSLDVTNNCNFSCLHCFNNSGSKVRVDTDCTDEEMMYLVSQIIMLNPHTVCLCGGETLCRGNLLQIINSLTNKNICVSMVSNGYLIDEDMAKKLIENGIKQVQISLDGIDAFQHDNFRGKKGAFNHAINAIKELKRNNIETLAVSFVPNKLNYRYIEEFIDLCVNLGVDLIRMMPFIPSGRGKHIGNNLILTDKEYFVFHRHLIRKRISVIEKIRIEWGDPLDHMRRMPINADNGLNTYSVEIKSNGDLTPTTYLPIVAGNLFLKSAREYWDEGYNFVWKNKELVENVNKLQTIYDFEVFEPEPFGDTKIYIEL